MDSVDRYRITQEFIKKLAVLLDEYGVDIRYDEFDGISMFGRSGVEIESLYDEINASSLNELSNKYNVFTYNGKDIRTLTGTEKEDCIKRILETSHSPLMLSREAHYEEALRILGYTPQEDTNDCKTSN